MTAECRFVASENKPYGEHKMTGNVTPLTVEALISALHESMVKVRYSEHSYGVRFSPELLEEALQRLVSQARRAKEAP